MVKLIISHFQYLCAIFQDVCRIRENDLVAVFAINKKCLFGKQFKLSLDRYQRSSVFKKSYHEKEYNQFSHVFSPVTGQPGSWFLTDSYFYA